MFVPLHDNTPLKVIRFQHVTIAIIVLNTVIYAVTGAVNSEAVLLAIASGWGLVPGELLGLLPPAIGYDPVPEPATLLTYQFLHGGWWHLISNMLFLWVFADNIEDAFGHVAFAVFYLVCGVLAALAHVAMQPGSPAPLVGASGAVAGVLGAYIVLYPKARVWVLLFMRLPIRIGALWVLGSWFVLQIASYWLDPGLAESGVAWGAHIGGFLAGAALTHLFRRRLLLQMGK